MAQEISLQAVLQVQRNGTTVQGSGSGLFTQTGSRSASVTQNVATDANSTLQIDGSTAIAWAFVKNNGTDTPDSSKYVHVAYDNASPFTAVIAKLRSGEFCLVPLKASSTALYAKAFGYAGAPGLVEVMFVGAQA